MNKVLDTIRLKTFDEVRSSWELECRTSPIEHQFDLDIEKVHQSSNLKDFQNSTIILVPWPTAIMDHLSTMTVDNLLKRLPHLVMPIDSLIDLVDDSIAMPSYVQHIYDSAIEVKSLIAQKYFSILKTDVLTITEKPQPAFDVLDLFVQHTVTAMVVFGAEKELKKIPPPEQDHDREQQELDEDVQRRASLYSSLASDIRELRTQLSNAREARKNSANQAFESQTVTCDNLLQEEIQLLLDDLREERSQLLIAFDLNRNVKSSHSD